MKIIMEKNIPIIVILIIVFVIIAVYFFDVLYLKKEETDIREIDVLNEFIGTWKNFEALEGTYLDGNYQNGFTEWTFFENDTLYISNSREVITKMSSSGIRYETWDSWYNYSYFNGNLTITPFNSNRSQWYSYNFTSSTKLNLVHEGFSTSVFLWAGSSIENLELVKINVYQTPIDSSLSWLIYWRDLGEPYPEDLNDVLSEEKVHVDIEFDHELNNSEIQYFENSGINFTKLDGEIAHTGRFYGARVPWDELDKLLNMSIVRQVESLWQMVPPVLP